MTRALRRSGLVVVAVLAAVWDVRDEIAHVFAILGGWALVTWAVASFSGVWEVWPLSGGLLLLSIAGWKHLGVLFSAGVYALKNGDARRG